MFLTPFSPILKFCLIELPFPAELFRLFVRYGSTAIEPPCYNFSGGQRRGAAAALYERCGREQVGCPCTAALRSRGPPKEEAKTYLRLFVPR